MPPLRALFGQLEIKKKKVFAVSQLWEARRAALWLGKQ